MNDLHAPVRDSQADGACYFETMTSSASTAAATIRVLIVDRPGWLYHASAALAHGGELELVGRALDAEGAAALAADAQPHVVVVNLPSDSAAALTTIRALRRDVPAAQLVAFATQTARLFIRSAFESGVSGLLFKDDNAEVLADVVRTVCKGERYCSLAWQNLFLLESDADDEPAAVLPVLTRREWDVITLIAESMNSGEIAKALGIEITTVHAHRANIMKKLKLHKVAGVVKWYEQHKHRRIK